MTVSVVIPSYNSRKTLEPALERLAALTHPDLIEVIVVDSSDDGTGSWLEGLRMPGLRVIRLPHKTIPAVGRNIGASQAKGDVLAFIDADAYPDEAWIPAIVRAVSEGCRVGGGSVLVPPFQKDRPIAWAQYFLQFSDFMPRGRRRRVSFTPSCNLFCERKLFAQTGGFPEVRAAEDVLFGLEVSRLAPFWFEPAAKVYHIFREDKPSYLSNQRMLGEYILRYRRRRSMGYGRVGAKLILVPGLAFKFMRIGVRVAQAGRASWAAAWARSTPLLIEGIRSWTAGYWTASNAAEPFGGTHAERVDLCGVAIDNVTMDDAVDRILYMARQNQPSFVVTPNVDHIVQLQKSAEFCEVYRRAALVVPDGMPLLWAGRFLGTPFREKVSGSDLLPALCPGAAAHGLSLFLLGGRPGSAESSRARLEREFPGIRIAGTYCPPVGFDKDPQENAKAIQAVRSARPDILLVGLGTPKQEFWIARHVSELGVPVSIGVGATFEFLAGIVRRAPEWMQRAGLEWFWRLLAEPRRLWRRYLIKDPIFFWYVLRQKCAGR